MKVIPSLLFDFHNDCIDLDGNILFRKICSMEEYGDYKSSVYGPRHDLENELTDRVRSQPEKVYHMPGYSDTGEALTEFLLDMDYSDGHEPNFRERLVCPITRLNNRQRFICNYLRRIVDLHNYSSIFTFEQATPVYRFISQRLSNANILGSEYLGIYAASGGVINGIRHEDATDLTFNDESFDIVFSSEVLNRTPDLQKTLCETSRVLKKGGRFIFSTPFAINAKETRQRARITNGEVHHIFDARYFVGPHTRDQQSPVFYDLGWDIFETMKDAGFKNAYLLCFYSAFYGYLGEGLQSIFVAEK